MGQLGSALETGVNAVQKVSDVVGDGLTNAAGMVNDGLTNAAGMVNKGAEQFASFMDSKGDNAWTRMGKNAVTYAAAKTAKRLENSIMDDSLAEIPKVSAPNTVDAEKLRIAHQAPDAQEMLNILMQKAEGR